MVFEYKYIICGQEAECYNYMFSDANNLKNTVFIPYKIFDTLKDQIIQEWIGKFFRHARNRLIDKMTCIYLMKKIKPHVLRIANYNDKICFVFLKSSIYTRAIDAGFSKFIKNEFPNAEIVVFFNDLVEKYSITPIDELKCKTNNVFTYDKNQSIKYEMSYVNAPYSLLDVKQECKNNNTVYFCGAAKDRFDDILKAYYKLVSDGFVCNFYVIGVPKDKRIDLPGMNYLDKYLSYEENLELAAQNKIILELVQGNSTGRTIRVGEAIRLGKYLVTNNLFMLKDEIYDKRNIEVFDDIEKMNLDRFLDSECIYTQKQIELIEVNYFLKQIEAVLQERG